MVKEIIRNHNSLNKKIIISSFSVMYIGLQVLGSIDLLRNILLFEFDDFNISASKNDGTNDKNINNSITLKKLKRDRYNNTFSKGKKLIILFISN